MKHNLPSVNTLLQLTSRYTGGMNDPRSELTPLQRAKMIRKILEDTTRMHTYRLAEISDILNLHGVEYIPRGYNKRSPAIDYVNSGDPYNPTLMYIPLRGFKVGCWGHIVESGNYY